MLLHTSRHCSGWSRNDCGAILKGERIRRMRMRTACLDRALEFTASLT